MPDDPARPALRASDADRERVVDSLSGHAAAGRLTVDELSERMDAAYAATTMPQLQALLADLPVDSPDDADVPSREEVVVRKGSRGFLASYGLVMLLLVVIWAVTGAGYFWPIWPAIGMGFGTALNLLRTREEIREISTAPREKRRAAAARIAERRERDEHSRPAHPLPRPPRH